MFYKNFTSQISPGPFLVLGNYYLSFPSSLMNDSYLTKKLLWIVVIKLVVLFALWWGFIRDQRVDVDPSTMMHTTQQPTQGETRHGQ